MKGKFHGDKIYPFIIKKKRETLDIDGYEDLELAEFYLKGRS